MNSLLTSEKCLVLNKKWTPVGTVTLQRAIIMLFSSYEDGTPKARIVDPTDFQPLTWDDWAKIRPAADEKKIVASNIFFKVPEVILLSRYEKLPKPKVHFSRRTLYKRDNYTCQYCGKQFPSEELTIDHVVPKSHGGPTTWENVLLACVDCNRRKANRTPQQAGMKPLKEPTKPSPALFKYDTLKPVKSWESFLGEMYWSVGIGDKED